MLIAPVYWGFDVTNPAEATVPAPPGGRPPVVPAAEKSRALLAYVYQHTNMRIAGGYITDTGDRWHPIFAPLWLSGWGLALFDNAGPQGGLDTKSFDQFQPPTNSWAFVGGQRLPLVFQTERDGE